MDNKRLGRRFRDQFIQGLRQLIQQGKVKIQAGMDLPSTLNDLQDRDWVVFIEPPPHADCRPEQVLKYLARYLTGGPISDRRLIRLESGQVTFFARSSDKSGKQVPVTLPAVEFVRRWSLHILPPRFTKTRCFGGWSNTQRAQYQTLCQHLAPEQDAPDNTSPSPAADPSEDAQLEVRKCPKCQSPMELVSSTRRPSWRELFYGPDHPTWVEWLDTT